jgi:hypothetical protein
MLVTLYVSIRKKKKRDDSMRSETPAVSNNQSNGSTSISVDDIDAAIEAKMRQRNPNINKTKAELRYIRMQETIVSILKFTKYFV